jgi:hypothetical protein
MAEPTSLTVYNYAIHWSSNVRMADLQQQLPLIIELLDARVWSCVCVQGTNGILPLCVTSRSSAGGACKVIRIVIAEITYGALYEF